MSARSAARAMIRRAQDALDRGAVSDLPNMLADIAQALEHPRLNQLRRLERQLAHMAPGERAAAIRERMGLSKSGYYKLRAMDSQSTKKVDWRAV